MRYGFCRTLIAYNSTHYLCHTFESLQRYGSYTVDKVISAIVNPLSEPCIHSYPSDNAKIPVGTYLHALAGYTAGFNLVQSIPWRSRTNSKLYYNATEICVDFMETDKASPYFSFLNSFLHLNKEM